MSKKNERIEMLEQIVGRLSSIPPQFWEMQVESEEGIDFQTGPTLMWSETRFIRKDETHQ